MKSNTTYLVQHNTSGEIAIIVVDVDGDIIAELTDIRQADVPNLTAAIEGGDDCHMGDQDRALDVPTAVVWSDWRVLAESPKTPAPWGNNPIYDDNGYTIRVPHQRPADAVPGPLTEVESHDLNNHYYVDSASAEDALYTKVKATRPHQYARILSIIAERRESRQ